MYCAWFKFMLSIPRSGIPTNVARFTEISSLLFYTTLGLIFLCFPVVPRTILFLPHFTGRAEGYLRLIGLGIFIISFLFVVTSRANLRSPGQGNLLASIPMRLVVIPAVLLTLYYRSMINILFALAFIVVDSILSIITFVKWWKETDEPSFGKFFGEIWQILFTYKDGKMRNSSILVQANGIVYILIGGVFMIRPDFAQWILSLDPFSSFSDGYLASVFLITLIHGSQYLFNGRTNYPQFNIAVVFYRFAITIPIMFVLYFTKRIELLLCVCACVLDGVFSVATLMFLLCEGFDGIESEQKHIKLKDEVYDGH